MMSYFAISYLGLILLLPSPSFRFLPSRETFACTSREPLNRLSLRVLPFAHSPFLARKTRASPPPSQKNQWERQRPFAARLPACSKTGPELVAAHLAGQLEPVRLGDSRGKDRVKLIFPLSRSFRSHSEDSEASSEATRAQLPPRNNAIAIATHPIFIKTYPTYTLTREQSPITRQLEVITSIS